MLSDMRIYIFSVLFAPLFALSVSAQPAAARFGELPPDELSMQVYPADSTAEAVMLYERGDYKIFRSNQYGSELELKVYKRLKILSEAGFGWADVEIPYFSQKDKADRILELRARITLPSGKFYHFDRSEFFLEKTSERYSVYKASLPAVEVGAIVEFEYTLLSRRMFRLPAWYFQGSIPVRHSEVVIENHSYYSYATLLEPGTEMKMHHLSGGGKLYESGDTELVAREGHLVMNNAPAIEKESYLTTIDDYRARIRFQLSEISNGTVVQKVLTSWEETAQTLKGEDFGRFYRKSRYFRDLYNALQPHLKGIKAPRAKAEAIYGFLSRRIAWNRKFRSFPDQSPDDLLAKGSGSSGDIAIALTALLQAEGLEAHPVLTSTRSHGKMTMTYPIIDQFNHLLVLVELEEQALLLDTPGAFQPFGALRRQSLNNKGWVANPDRPVWIDIQPGTDERKIFCNLELEASGQLKGTLLVTHRGVSAPAARALAKQDQAGKYWSRRLPEGCTVARIKRKDLDKADIHYAEQLEVLNASSGMVVNGFLYFQPVIFSRYLESAFRLQKRNYPVDFACPIREISSVTIRLPEGWAVEHLPPERRQSLGEKGVVFEYKATVANRQLKIETAVEINQLRFEPEQYSQLKALFESVAEQLSSQVVLRKI